MSEERSVHEVSTSLGSEGSTGNAPRVANWGPRAQHRGEVGESSTENRRDPEGNPGEEEVEETSVEGAHGGSANDPEDGEDQPDPRKKRGGGQRRRGVQKTSLGPDEISSSVREADLIELRTYCWLDPDFSFIIPNEGERVNAPPEGCVSIFLDSIRHGGFRFPVPDPVREILNRLGISPSQLPPNGIALIIAFIFMMVCNNQNPSPENFFQLFQVSKSPRSSPDRGYYYVSARGGKKLIAAPSSSHGSEWKKRFIFVRHRRGEMFGISRGWVERGDLSQVIKSKGFLDNE